MTTLGDSLRDHDAGSEGHRDTGRAILRGFLCRCPNCGRGALFRAYLKTVDACAVCGEAMDLHRADDAPPYLTIFVIAHLVIGGMFFVETATSDTPVWLHLLVWPLATILGSLWLLPRMKGAVVGLQWAQRMHGFSGTPDTPADVL